MSKEYRQILEQNYELTIKELLEPAPYFVSDFYNSMHHGEKEITTQLIYIRNVIHFLNYELQAIAELKDTELKDFPLEVLTHLTIQDMNEYRSFLFKKKLSNTTAKQNLASVSVFFKYLCRMELLTNNPMTNFEYPVLNKKHIVKLDSSLCSKLLDGILKNNKYLATSEYGQFVVDIPPAVWLKRERTVIRNYAIIMLFLGTGLRVSELVGLDLDDINFSNSYLTVLLKGGDEAQVYFSDEVANALKLYINGPQYPKNFSEKIPSISDVAEWAKNHITDAKLDKSLEKAFPDISQDDELLIKQIVAFYRRHGRDGFKPDRNNKALFLSSRSTRLTVRMVELMIKEMVQTYLPDYDDKDIFSPHKLRATCATRILTQTGDIELASTQLNHKSVAVTAAFYAELQKEKRKDKIKNLDLTKW